MPRRNMMGYRAPDSRASLRMALSLTRNKYPKKGRLAIPRVIGLPVAFVLFLVTLLPLLPAHTAHAQEQKPQEEIIVTGKLGRVMAIGGESTGWSIHLDHPMTVKEKEVDSLEIDYAKAKRLAKLENKEVRASGKLTHRHGVETGERLVFEVSSIQEVKQN